MGFQDRPYYRDEPGQPGAGPRSMSMVNWLLVVNCVVFLLDGVLASSRRGAAGAPSAWGAFTIGDAVYGFQLWRWFTYQFIHAGFFHILVNMLSLYFFGRLMEQWWGSRRFLAFYLLCGSVGAVLFAILAYVPGLMEAGPQTRLVGASGSVFGILVGCAVVYPHQRVMLLFPPVPMSMRTMALIFLGLAVLSLLAGAEDAGSQAAHLGGAMLGYVLVKWSWLLGFADMRAITANRSDGWEKRRRKEEAARLAEQAEVDRILRKVKDHGLQSLTSREKKALQKATDRQRRAS